ncbi:MAG: DUF805 domain-containing protein [Tateyamaria sp.]
MNLGAAVRTCLGKYVTFSGRASRPEYWLFFLFVVIVGVLAGIIDWSLFGRSVTDDAAGTAIYSLDRQPVSSLATIALFLPHFAAAWRRMQDTGRSGIYVLLPSLISFAALAIAAFGLGLADIATGRLDSLLTSATLLMLIPLLILGFLSPLIVFIWLTRPSQPGANTYGPNPHDMTGGAH